MIYQIQARTDNARRFAASYGNQFQLLGIKASGGVTLRSTLSGTILEVRKESENKNENKAGIYVNGELFCTEW